MIQLLRHKLIKYLRFFFNKTKYLLVPKTKYLEDKYFSYAEYVCGGGMLEKGNIYVWDYVIQKLDKKSNILEIGSFVGLSTVIITYLSKKYKKDINFYNVDFWKLQDDNKDFFDKELKFKEYNEFVKKTYINNLIFFHSKDLPYSIHDTSQSFFLSKEKDEELTDIFNRKVKLPEKFDFCFIDGDHSYDGAKLDFLNVNKHLNKGAYILFDDSSDGSGFGGINKLMSEVLKNPNFKLIMKNPNYLFQKIK
ncbi:MAG: hypothetical protein B6I24_01610 [Bacteroidetes bacterium 4572_128]|nr:MAG: hypothetical protein B6I24_01610 [Bacteroidetes bacterium 4572_128]